MSSVEHLLIVYRKTNVLMVFRLLNSIVLLGIILLVRFCHGTFITYMVLYLLAEAVFTLWIYWQVNKSTSHFTISFDQSLIKTIFAFSIPIGLASMIGTINIELDKLVITSFFSTEELAIYTNASRELPVTMIATSLTAVLLPQMVRLLHNDQKREAVELLKSATTISFSIICFISVACFVFAPEVMTVFYSKKYLDGVAVFRVYSLVLMLKCTYFGMMLNASGKTKFIMYSSIGSLILNVIFNYIFYFTYGFIGPAIATLASSWIMQMVQLFYTGKICNIKMRDIFPWKNTALLFLLNISIGGVIGILHGLVSNYVNAVVSAILLGVMWFAVTGLILYKPIMKQWKILNA